MTGKMRGVAHDCTAPAPSHGADRSQVKPRGALALYVTTAAMHSAGYSPSSSNAASRLTFSVTVVSHHTTFLPLVLLPFYSHRMGRPFSSVTSSSRRFTSLFITTLDRNQFSLFTTEHTQSCSVGERQPAICIQSISTQ